MTEGILPHTARQHTVDFLVWWHTTVCLEPSWIGRPAAARATYACQSGPLSGTVVEYRWDAVERDRILVLRTIGCDIARLRVARLFAGGAADRDRPTLDELHTVWHQITTQQPQ